MKGRVLIVLKIPEAVKEHFVGKHGPSQVVAAWGLGHDALFASSKQIVSSKGGILAVATSKGWHLLGFLDEIGLCGVYFKAFRQPHVSELSGLACYFARGRHVLAKNEGLSSKRVAMSRLQEVIDEYDLQGSEIATGRLKIVRAA